MLLVTEWAVTIFWDKRGLRGVVMTDKAFDVCIRQMQAGEKEGLRAAYEEYNAMIYSAVYEILKNHQNAEDVTSEYFIKLWKISDTYRVGRGHRAWMLTIARNMAVDLLRKQKKEVIVGEIDDFTQLCSPSPEELLVHEIAMEQALLSLEQEEREIISLKIMGELTFKEVARILEKPIGTVAWKYQKAIGKLKRCGYE